VTVPDAPAKIPVPWTHDPAFLAWVDESIATCAAAFGLNEAGGLPGIPTASVLLGAVALVLFHGLLMARHVFLSGPDLFQNPPAPDELATLRAEFESYKAAHP
jgi:hypothetical protein